MISVITGDIIHSGQPEVWLNPLKHFLNSKGKSPKKWEIYRGDEFQLEIENIENVLLDAIHLKSIIKTQEHVDLRISIGIGNKDYDAPKITECNGSAFVHSGRNFNELKKEKLNLAVKSDDEVFDREINLMLKFALQIMDKWSTASAEIVCNQISNRNKSQSELAELLKINQSAISQRLKRANFDLLMDLNQYFAEQVKLRFK